jgi:hypothetical protein
MTLLKTEVSNIVKDPVSGALLNIDRSALEARRLKKRNALKVENLERDVNDIKSELEEIRSLLLQLVNR